MPMFYRSAAVLFVTLSIVGCSKNDEHVAEEQAAEAELKAAIRDAKAYDFQDGLQYGYTADRTADDVASGRAAGAITMFTYAGQRNGVHQLHQRNGNILTALECTHPCDVMKVMMLIEGTGLPPNVQRFRVGENAIASLAFKDAAQGHLQQYTVDVSGTSYELWMDETKGLVRSKATAQQ